MKQLTTAKRCRPSSGWLSNLSIVLIKDGRVTLSCQEVSQMFDCFILFLTNHAFVILTLVFNLNMHKFFSILDQAYLTRAQLLECCNPGWRFISLLCSHQHKTGLEMFLNLKIIFKERTPCWYFNHFT